jgi:hypothetical protein
MIASRKIKSGDLVKVRVPRYSNTRRVSEFEHTIGTYGIVLYVSSSDVYKPECAAVQLQLAGKSPEVVHIPSRWLELMTDRAPTLE